MEQCRQKLHLDDGGVLKFVQKHGVIVGSQLVAHSGRAVGEPVGQDQQVGKVDDSFTAFAFREGVDQVEEAQPQVIGIHHPLEYAGQLANFPQRRSKFVEEYAHLINAHCVFSDLTRKTQCAVHKAGYALVASQIAWPHLNNVGHHLNCACLSDQTLVRVDTQTHPVVVDDLLCEGVVCHTYRVLSGADAVAVLAQCAQARSKPLTEFSGCFA